MGEAKRRKLAAKNSGPMVFHHTSTLRTNLIWMSGYIEVEGNIPPVLHPELGEIETDASLRRGMHDFPPLAWFTRRNTMPGCLTKSSIFFIDKKTGERRSRAEGRDLSNAIALNRLALGFPVVTIPVIPWPEHYGYRTSEGRELNETAIEAGDDPEDWYVSEKPVDVLKSTEVWISKSIMSPRLKRHDAYLKQVHRMVQAGRQQKIYIPPSWLPVDQAREVATELSRQTGIKFEDI